MKVAREFSTSDWRKLRPKLDVGEVDAWNKAIEVLRVRIESRYLEPIRKLQPESYSGFAIMALNCLLMDTLMSFRDGRVEHGSTGRAFKKFLESERFKDFNSKDKSEFFSCVRNGLFHDGETRKGWRIRKDTEKLLTKTVAGEDKIKTINRDLFSTAIREEFDSYLNDLKRAKDMELRKNFLARMDQICGEPVEYVTYFAYGSNMSSERLSSKIGSSRSNGKGRFARLAGFQLRFNKRSSIDNTGKANIESVPSSEVWGVVHLLNSEEFENLKLHEHGYAVCEKSAVCHGETIEVKTFIAKSPEPQDIEASLPYLQDIRDGAIEYGIPLHYVAACIPSPREQ